MKAIVKTPLANIRAKEEELKTKDVQLQMLGVALAEEKAKNIQKDIMIQSLGQQLTQLKVEVITLKGAINNES